VSRQNRRTESLETQQGVLTSYEEIEPVLSAAEARGRALVFDWARSTAETVWTPTDIDLLDLHHTMFETVFDWAGRTRVDARGPGGVVHVATHEIRIELRKLADDLHAWVAASWNEGEPDLGTIAAHIADAHHRFQWIHPFQDTNGRTGRVIDHGLLWATFGLAGATPDESPIIEYFPDPGSEDAYFEGLLEADLGRPDRLRDYYRERVEAAASAYG
jgi:fido (protein-threonine AMPylation protein)